MSAWVMKQKTFTEVTAPKSRMSANSIMPADMYDFTTAPSASQDKDWKTFQKEQKTIFVLLTKTFLYVNI